MTVCMSQSLMNRKGRADDFRQESRMSQPPAKKRKTFNLCNRQTNIKSVLMMFLLEDLISLVIDFLGTAVGEWSFHNKWHTPELFTVSQDQLCILDPIRAQFYDSSWRWLNKWPFPVSSHSRFAHQDEIFVCTNANT